MDRRSREALDRFLAADAAGRADEAEAALFAAFEGLVHDEPPPGFAARVLQRAGIAARPRLPQVVPRWLQAAIAASLLVTGGLALFLPGLLAPLVPEVSMAQAADAAGRALAWIAGALTALLELWHGLLDVALALRLPFETSATAAVATLCLLVSTGAFALLSHLIAQERNWSYVEPT